MAPRQQKDVRRADLIVPYQEPPAPKGDTADFTSTISTTLPMAAMFTRNKFVGWGSVVFSIQNWLGESEETSRTQTTPGYLSVILSLGALGVSYLPLFLQNPLDASSGTVSAAAPLPVA